MGSITDLTDISAMINNETVIITPTDADPYSNNTTKTVNVTDTHVPHNHNVNITDGPTLHDRPTTWWPPNIITIITKILATPTTPQKASLFTFELTQEASHRSFCVLKRFNKNLQLAIDAQQNSVTSYGSEFRPASILEPLLGLHPNWKHLKQLLLHGSQWPLSPITKRSSLEITKAHRPTPPPSSPSSTKTSHKGSSYLCHYPK